MLSASDIAIGAAVFVAVYAILAVIERIVELVLRRAAARPPVARVVRRGARS